MKEVIKQVPVIGSLARMARRLVSTSQDWLTERKLANINHPYGKHFAHILTHPKNPEADDGRNLILEIEKEREHMVLHNEPLNDGSLGEEGSYEKDVSIQAACQASQSPKKALFIYSLIRKFKPANIIELGTNVGISSAYQAIALKLNGQNGKLLTLEWSPYRLRLAKELHRKLGLKNIIYVQGEFAETLEKTLTEFGPVDFSFIDGNHEYQPTLDYFDKIWTHSAQNAIFVFDDIRLSGGMEQAWRELQADRRIVLAIDLNDIGICVGSREGYAKRYVLPVIRYALSWLYFSQIEIVSSGVCATL